MYSNKLIKREKKLVTAESNVDKLVSIQLQLQFVEKKPTTTYAKALIEK